MIVVCGDHIVLSLSHLQHLGQVYVLLLLGDYIKYIVFCGNSPGDDHGQAVTCEQVHISSRNT